MKKIIEIPEGYEARIEGNEVIIELKESEDEKIRKTLLRCCDDWEKGQFGCMAKEDVSAIRAYLEKQKEQKPANIDYISGIRDELLGIENNAKNIDGLTDSQWVAIRAAHRLLGEYLNSNQKPAEWSEEDEQFLLVCKNALNKYQRSDHWDANIISNWLEERLKSHHPQHITYVLDAPLGYDNDLNPIYPPINHWKPSEDQMAALRNVAYAPNTNNITLQSLYEQLRKSYSL